MFYDLQRDCSLSKKEYWNNNGSKLKLLLEDNIFCKEIYFYSATICYHLFTEKKKYISLSLCIVKDKLPQFLNIANKGHQNYVTDLYLNYFVSQVRLPIRVKDVYIWCQSCYTSQIKAQKAIKLTTEVIQSIKLIEMLEINFVDTVMTAYTNIRFCYILIIVNYFPTFSLRKAYNKHIFIERDWIFETHGPLVFCHPKDVGSQNSPCFVNEVMKNFFS